MAEPFELDAFRTAPSMRELTPELRAAAAAEPDVAFAYLFGSVAKGTAHAGSDVDIAVWLVPARSGPAEQNERVRLADRALEIEGALERRLRRPIQVVALNLAPPELRQNVLRHGHLVFSRDERLRTGFYVSHAREYLDFQPARAIFDRSMARRIREGAFGGGSRDGS